MCSTALFSFVINGELAGIRSLRQGYPIYSYWFLPAIEASTALLQHKIDQRDFIYNPKCQELKVSHFMSLFCGADPGVDPQSFKILTDKWFKAEFAEKIHIFPCVDAEQKAALQSIPAILRGFYQSSIWECLNHNQT